jgi:hypothetical protein
MWKEKLSNSSENVVSASSINVLPLVSRDFYANLIVSVQSK